VFRNQRSVDNRKTRVATLIVHWLRAVSRLVVQRKRNCDSFDFTDNGPEGVAQNSRATVLHRLDVATMFVGLKNERYWFYFNRFLVNLCLGVKRVTVIAFAPMLIAIVGEEKDRRENLMITFDIIDTLLPPWRGEDIIVVSICVFFYPVFWIVFVVE